MNSIYLRIQGFVNDEKAQDMVEYALLAGFIAVAAGAVLPGISTSISQIFSKMASLTTAASQK
jgi:Flp pilus assembly pilin Flp